MVRETSSLLLIKKRYRLVSGLWFNVNSTSLLTMLLCYIYYIVSPAPAQWYWAEELIKYIFVFWANEPFKLLFVPLCLSACVDKQHTMCHQPSLSLHLLAYCIRLSCVSFPECWLFSALFIQFSFCTLDLLLPYHTRQSWVNESSLSFTEDDESHQTTPWYCDDPKRACVDSEKADSGSSGGL